MINIENKFSEYLLIEYNRNNAVLQSQYLPAQQNRLLNPSAPELRQ